MIRQNESTDKRVASCAGWKLSIERDPSGRKWYLLWSPFSDKPIRVNSDQLTSRRKLEIEFVEQDDLYLSDELTDLLGDRSTNPVLHELLEQLRETNREDGK